MPRCDVPPLPILEALMRDSLVEIGHCATNQKNLSQFPTWERERRLEELYKRIRYTLIYSYKINRNNKIQIVDQQTLVRPQN